jgi:hypothetical protein
MDNWNALVVEMEQVDVMIWDDFKCELADLTEVKIPVSLRKDTLQRWVYLFADMYRKSKKFSVSGMGKIEELNSKVIENQDKVITLQDQLIRSKEEQLATVQTSVREEMAAVRDEVSSVQTAVKSELVSWTDALKRNSMKAVQPITMTSAKLKEAVKAAVGDEDRSHNIMVFGKPEVESEDVPSTVTDILADLGEKPRLVECRRIGAAKIGTCRPIKVKLTSSDAVAYVLKKAGTLKSTSSNRETYITADRNEEERSFHKKLVERMKLKIKEEPDMYHRIRDGVISSVRRVRTGSHTLDLNS